jgi:hypothetical protein
MNTLGQYGTTPINEIRDMAKLILNRRSRNDIDDTIDAFIIQGLNKLKAPSNLVQKTCRISLTDQKIGKLPKGFSQLIALRVPCDLRQVQDNNGLWVNYDYYLYVDLPFIETCGGQLESDMYNYNRAFTIRKDGYLCFYQEQGVDEVEMSYLGANVDSEGFFLIYEKFAIALQFWAAYMFALQNSGEYNSLQIREFKQGWLDQKKMIIGDDLQELWNLQKHNIQAIMQTRYWRITPYR